MSRQEFIDLYKHELFGVILDASHCRRSGSELSMFLTEMMRRTGTMLGEMYDDLNRQPQNGLANPRKEKV